jgi:sucrose-phosphate synthase
VGRNDATADMSSDLSEGEREGTPADSMPRAESNLALLISNTQDASAPDKEKPAKKLYIALLRCVRQP